MLTISLSRTLCEVDMCYYEITHELTWFWTQFQFNITSDAEHVLLNHHSLTYSGVYNVHRIGKVGNIVTF